MNTWTKLPESYQQRLYQNTLATVKHKIKRAENPTTAIVSSMEAVHVANLILLDYFTPEVPLEEPEIGWTDLNVSIDNNCTDDQLHFGMPGDRGDYEVKADKSDKSNAIPTTSQRRRAATELVRFALGTSDEDGYGCKHGNDVDDEQDASQPDDGSAKNVQD
jgi:hypothetical protein